MASSKAIHTSNSRKKKVWLYVFLGIFSFVAIGTYLFRTNIFKELIGPNIPFQVDEPPPAPDYSDSSAWAKRPQGELSAKPAVFYVHPTTDYKGSYGWNDDINDAKSREILEKVAIPNHAMPFNVDGNLWIPRYRQATLFSTLAYNDDTRGALELAYHDIETAFENFQNAIGKDTPFVLVGMNQGALHITRLLQTKIANTELSKRLIAVYLIDQTIAKDELNEKNYGDIKICTDKNQTHCIISYQAIDDNNVRNQKLFKNRSPLYTKGENYHTLANRENICVNPINGGSSDIADSSQNKGSAAATNLENNIEPAFLPFETGAICKNGILLVEHNRSQSLKPPWFELGTFYKIPNYNLFYQALQQDYQNRINVFTSQSKK